MTSAQKFLLNDFHWIDHQHPEYGIVSACLSAQNLLLNEYSVWKANDVM